MPFPSACCPKSTTRPWFAFDPAAAAFFTAAGITDATQKSAVNTLVLAFKAAGIWTSMKAIYPFVGGTSNSCSFNLVNPATFQITWHGTPVFSSTGVLGNAVDAYGDTGLTVGTTLSTSSNGAADYVHTFPTGGGESLLADYDGTANFGVQAGHTRVIFDNEYPDGRITDTASLVPGMYSMSRTSALAVTGYNNGASIITNSVAVSALSAQTVKLFKLGQAGAFTDELRSFTALYMGLSDTGEANLYTAVQAFQTTLGRNV